MVPLHPEDLDKYRGDNYAAMSGKTALTGFESRTRRRDGHDVYTIIFLLLKLGLRGNEVRVF